MRQLPRPEEAWHDFAGNGTSVNHVVLGPPGLFLLDSKNYSGEAPIEGGEFRARLLGDPEDGWVCHGMVSRMRAAQDARLTANNLDQMVDSVGEIATLDLWTSY